jgi:hypothetical protein
MGRVQAIRPQLEAERAAAALVDATWKLAGAMTEAATTMPPESLAEAAAKLLAETRGGELSRPAALVLEAVAGALLTEWTHGALDEADPPGDDDPELADVAA